MAMLLVKLAAMDLLGWALKYSVRRLRGNPSDGLPLSMSDNG